MHKTSNLPSNLALSIRLVVTAPLASAAINGGMSGSFYTENQIGEHLAGIVDQSD